MGTTVPIPFPLRVGAKTRTCSGPPWVMSRPARVIFHEGLPDEEGDVLYRASDVWQRTTPVPERRPARASSSGVAQRAEPCAVLAAEPRDLNKAIPTSGASAAMVGT